jgi:Type II CAAX prenyl endopeptidase Rce1-like
LKLLPKLHPLDLIVDRSRKEAAIAVGATWAAFLAALFIGGEVSDPASFVIGGCEGAVLVFIGFAAASRCRPLHPRPNAQRARLALLSLALGAGLGVANLGANRALASADPALHELLAERMATLEPLMGLFAAPVVEEVALRLFVMSVVAWVLSRFTQRPSLVFWIALGVSAVGFALLHLDRPFPADPTLANLYGAALVLKYSLAGLLPGWIFWRWGLPYAIVCHVAANATHLLLQPMVF